MSDHDMYIVAVIEDIQDNIGIMDKDEIWDQLEHILDVMFKRIELEEVL
jgi:hypothetical protein